MQAKLDTELFNRHVACFQSKILQYHPAAYMQFVTESVTRIQDRQLKRGTSGTVA